MIADGQLTDVGLLAGTLVELEEFNEGEGTTGILEGCLRTAGPLGGLGDFGGGDGSSVGFSVHLYFFLSEFLFCLF